MNDDFWGSKFGVLMFVRLYVVFKVLRDFSTVLLRSLVLSGVCGSEREDNDEERGRREARRRGLDLKRRARGGERGGREGEGESEREA